MIDEAGYGARPLVPSERQAARVPREPAREPAPVPDPATPDPATPYPATPEPAPAGARAPAQEPARRRSPREVLRDLDPREVVRGNRKLPFVALALAALVTQWDDQAWGVLAPDIRADLAIDVSVIITMQAILAFVFLQLTAPVFGYFADRLPRVWMLRTGSVVGYASSIATGFAGGFGALVATRAGVQAGNAVIQPAGFPLLADYYPSRVRGRLYGFLAVIGNLGAFAGPIIAGSIGALWGWRPAVIALGAAALGVSVLLFLVREPARGYADRIELGLDEEAARREPRPVGWAEAWRSAGSVVTIRRLWFAAPFLGANGFAVLGLMGQYYRDEFGTSTQMLGVISSMNFGVAMVALLFAGSLADRILARDPGLVMRIMGGVLVLQAVTFVALWASPAVLASVGVNVVIATLNALFLPAYAVMLSLTVPARIRGLGLQSHLPLMGVGGVAVSLVAGPLIDAGGFRPAMLLFVPTSLIAAAILGTSAHGVARDIRSARAAALAAEDARRGQQEGALLLCRGVEVEHDGVQVLFGVDLDVADGEIVALLGTNGAGKSTLLRAIAGVHPASVGGVIFDGDDITHLPAHEVAARGVVMLPGGRAVFPTLSVRENLDAAAWLARDPAAARRRIADVLDTFPILDERLDLPAGDLSGGEQQMLAVGQALVMAPRLLMIDELSLGLAPAVVEQLLDLLRTLHERGTTIVLVEQSVNLALTIAQRAVFLEKGSVVFDGPTAELLRRGDIVRSVFLGHAVTGSDLTLRPKRRARGERSTVLDATDVTVRFGGVAAVEHVSVSLREREIVGIIGPNGAGKTTLFDAISGFAPMAWGRIVVAERDVTALPPAERARAGLGRSFQHALLFPTLTVRDAIAVALETRLDEHGAISAAAWLPRVRRAEREARRRIDHLLELVGLEHAADAFVSELSTAMRRIVDLACVTAMQPRALLLDEPSSGLAQAEAEEVAPLLRRLVAETGCGLLIIEHDVPMVSSLADRMLAMDLGRVIADGDPAQVVADERVIRSALGGREDVITRTGARPTTME